MHPGRICLALLASVWFASPTRALDVCLPTANNALLRPGHDAEFFQPTVEGTTESGMFGAVRRGGRRFHEGIDIKPLQRDKRGETLDPVHAAADGEVAFTNTKPGLSNYGRYVVLAHRWDGVEVFTLYAHLSEIAPGIVTGQPVKKSQLLGTMGRSTNTREGIPRERAHLHFETNVMLNPNFRIWYPKREPKAPPFGNFNGKNLFALDSAALFRACAANPQLNFAAYMSRQPVSFTVLVGARPFPWLQNHSEQLQPATGPNVIAYEIGVTGWGIPVTVAPRTAAELTETQQRTLRRGQALVARVNEKELDRNDRELIKREAKRGWQFTESGREWVEILTYAP